MGAWTLPALIQRFKDEGFTVLETEAGMTGDRVAWISISNRVVAVHPDLLERQKRAALLHEWIHFERADVGVQPAWVERAVDEEVARRLIDAESYQFWEAQYGWHTGGIAAALDVPRWVVQAYRRLLTRGHASIPR